MVRAFAVVSGGGPNLEVTSVMPVALTDAAIIMVIVHVASSKRSFG